MNGSQIPFEEPRNAEWFLPLVSHMPHLRVLSLSGLYWDASLLDAIRQKCPQLESLTLKTLKKEDQGLLDKSFKSLIHACKQLTSLSLRLQQSALSSSTLAYAFHVLKFKKFDIELTQQIEEPLEFMLSCLPDLLQKNDQLVYLRWITQDKSHENPKESFIPYQFMTLVKSIQQQLPVLKIQTRGFDIECIAMSATLSKIHKENFLLNKPTAYSTCLSSTEVLKKTKATAGPWKLPISFSTFSFSDSLETQNSLEIPFSEYDLFV
jgi:hypothetical protein